MPIYRAISNGNLEIVRYLTEMGANIHANNNEFIQFAAKSGHLEIVRYLAEMGADINANNDAPIKMALTNGHFEIVRYLAEMDWNHFLPENLANNFFLEERFQSIWNHFLPENLANNFFLEERLFLKQKLYNMLH